MEFRLTASNLMAGCALGCTLALSPLVTSCGSQNANTVSTAPTVQKLKIGQPANSTMNTADVRRTYQLRVQEAGKLRVKLSWNNPDGFVRFVFRTQAKTDSLDATARQELIKEQDVEPGIYYIELVGTGRAMTYNLLASMVE